MSLQPGSQLGSYEIIALVGAGGMGEVWRARDPRLGREIAIKVLPADVASRPERLARFEREARAVAALNHPNVVTLHSIEESGGVRFLTLELVEGAGFETLVEPAGLPVSRVLALLLPVAEALAAAHARGIVHRDLKPANVMLTRDGRVKVLDFGLARHDDDSGAIDVTTAPTVAVPASSAGLVVGTVPYMSPEQLRGERVDARSDLFSFGVLAYELATGRRPFGGTSTAEITSSILRDAPPPVRGTRADLPAAFERLVARCLEKDPERRIQTAKDVRNELELLQRDASSPAMPAAAPAAGPAPSLAVLPFENRSRDADDEYFADGLADELLGVLGKIRGLRVAARTSSRQFRDSAEPASAIGTKLGVAMLLEGSVRKSGNRVRIAVQLVEAASGFHAWSETYDRTLDDIFAVQDDIARAVVQEVRVHLLGQETDSKASGEVKAEVAAAAAGRGTDAEAHRLYLQGRFLVDRLGEADITTGIQILTRAVEIDPSHARAWAVLSWAYTLSAATGREAVEIGMPKAQEAALHAIALAPELPEPHVALGRVHQWYTFDWKAAVDCCGRALALAPDDPDVLRANATIAYNLCDFDRARDLVRRSLELDPIAVTGLAYMGRILISRGDYAEAEAVLRRAIDLAPGATSSHAILSHVLMELGRHDEALATAQAEPMEWARLYSLGMIYHRMGRRADSDEALARLVAGWASKALFQIASIHAVRGEADAAFEWLERAYAERDSGVGITKASPHLRSLHSDPRWRPFLRKIGLED